VSRSLCESCGHVREVVTPRGSRFLLCRRSLTDPAYPRYPPQPVARCAGHMPLDAAQGDKMPANHPFTPRRPLGRTGFLATALGIGDLADRSVPIEACVATARRALDAGLNAIDTAPNYEAGYSEEIVGRAVRGLPRDRVFVIDKIDELEAPVGPQADGSLGRLGLDHTDAFVFHNLSDPAVFDRLCHPGGGFDQLADMVRAGKCRFRGISSHDPEVLKAALAAGVCDVVMFPVGPFADDRYITEVLPLAKARGVGTVCFKAFGAGKLLGDTAGYNQPLRDRPRGKVSSGGTDGVEAALPRLTAAECLHYVLTLDPDVALLGLSYPNEQDQAFAAARAFCPLSAAEMADVRRRAAEARLGKGPCWWNPDPDARHGRSNRRPPRPARHCRTAARCGRVGGYGRRGVLDWRSGPRRPLSYWGDGHSIGQADDPVRAPQQLQLVLQADDQLGIIHDGLGREPAAYPGNDRPAQVFGRLAGGRGVGVAEPGGGLGQRQPPVD
jgi:1-deoxyxylulose-5-phosphate synthase